MESPIPNLRQYLPADGWFQEISQLAEKIERMDREEQIKFSGILDCSAISTIEDVLQAADSLSLYEYIPGVTCSRELGGYVVENDFPERYGLTWTIRGLERNTMRPTPVPIQHPDLWCEKRKNRKWKRDPLRGSRYGRRESIEDICKERKLERWDLDCSFLPQKRKQSRSGGAWRDSIHR